MIDIAYPSGRAKAWVCDRSLAGFVDFLSLVSVVCCQVEVSCVGPITRPEESYRVWCGWV